MMGWWKHQINLHSSARFSWNVVLYIPSLAGRIALSWLCLLIDSQSKKHDIWNMLDFTGLAYHAVQYIDPFLFTVVTDCTRL